MRHYLVLLVALVLLSAMPAVAGHYDFQTKSTAIAQTSKGSVIVMKGIVTDPQGRTGEGTFYKVGRFLTGYAALPGGTLTLHPSGVTTFTTNAEMASMYNDVLPSAPDIEPIDNGPFEKASGPIVVDLALPYTDDAINHWATGSREAVLALQMAAEAFLNDSLTKSGAAAGKIHVVGTDRKVAWNPNDPRLKSLTTAGQVARGIGEPVANSLKADLVLTVVGETNVPGASGGFAGAYNGSKNNGYGVVTVAGFFRTLLHELAHLMGPNLDHRKGFIQCGKQDDLATQFSTVTIGPGTMTGFKIPSWCTESVVLTDRVSNPKRFIAGYPTGDATHDNAAEFRKSFPKIAKFR